MPLTAGRYRIVNAQWENAIVLLDADDRSELVGRVQDLDDEECGDQVPLLFLHPNCNDLMMMILVGCLSSSAEQI